MDPINNIELTDQNVYPDDDVLQSVHGKSYDACCDMLMLFDANDMFYEWRYYKDGKSWLCKVQKKKRTIIWISACKGYLKATIYFPEKYIDGLYHLEIAEETKNRIKATKNIDKSKPCMLKLWINIF